MFPRQAVGSVVGLGGMAGALGAMLILKVTGWILGDTSKADASTYLPLFIIAGSAYLLALLIIHVLVPRLEPARIEGEAVA
jgi:ACS family hexuronate transporter-like MFS transporter